MQPFEVSQSERYKSIIYVVTNTPPKINRMKKLRNRISAKGLAVIATVISFFGMTEKVSAQNARRLPQTGVVKMETKKVNKTDKEVMSKSVDFEQAIPKMLTPNWGDVAKDLPEKLE